MSTPRPFGTWPSPITAQVAATQGLRLGAPAVDGPDVYWLEGRPAEGGRNVLVRRARDGTVRELTPPGFNVRTRVHEYGGGALRGAPRRRRVLELRRPAPLSPGSRRGRKRAGRAGRRSRPKAAGTSRTPWWTPHGTGCCACARTTRSRGASASTRSSACRSTAAAAPGGSSPRATTSTPTPRLSPDGSRLAWICWRHPNMPWDGTELWVADVDAAGGLDQRAPRGRQRHRVDLSAGLVARTATLYFVSDRDDCWRLYRVAAGLQTRRDPAGRARSSAPTPRSGARSGSSAPRRGRSRAPRGWSCRTRAKAGGIWAALDLDAGTFRDMAHRARAGRLAGSGGRRSGARGGQRHGGRCRDRGRTSTSGAVRVLRAVAWRVDRRRVRVGARVDLVSDRRRTAPRTRSTTRRATAIARRSPASGRRSSSSATAARRRPPMRRSICSIQFWTSRGFAVVDVNYGGSTGYGRAYRQRLNGQWGIVDVDDCVRAARFLAARGQGRPGAAHHPRRQRRRLHDAGGADLSPDVFKAGASYYGVSDLEALAHDTHKFESRYLDSLIGPYPAAKALYDARSPIHAVDRLSCPLILFQGLEDKVVPPNQSEMMVEALRAQGPAGRLRGVRGRAARLPQGREHHPQPRSRALLLRRGLRLRAGRSHRAGRNRQPPRSNVAIGLQTDRHEAALSRGWSGRGPA